MPPTIPTLAFTKTYADLDILDEIDLDNAYNSFQTHINTEMSPNIVQVGLDMYGSTYTFNDNGVQTVTNTLFDKQTATTSYAGGDISIGVAADAAWGSVDALNAIIAITPEKAGKYKATFSFTHIIQLNATSEGVCETTFRITDGTTISNVVRSGGYQGTVVANAVRIVQPITIVALFTFADTLAKTVTLQKFVRSATNVASQVVAATGTTGEFFAMVEKV